MKQNTAKAKLKAGEPALGTWLSLASSLSAEYLAHLGWDWLVVDTEHSPIDFKETLHCFQAIATTDTIPLARVAWNDPMLIKRLLDAGAMGLVVPMVNTPEEAEQAVQAMKYPPAGFRSLGGGRAMVYGSDYLARANEEILVVLQIEHIEAVKRARDILSVPGVDACFIGPNDLAGSMGLPTSEANKHPDHNAAVAEVLQAARDCGVAPGIHAFNTEMALRRLEEGFQFVAVASDAAFLRQAAAAALEAVRK